MKTIKITILSIFVSLCFGSCEFLDKEPTKLTEVTDINSLLTGTYATLQQSTFYGAAYLFLVGGDDLGHYGGSGRAPYKSGLISNNANSSDPDVAGLWYTLYAGINRANLVLENIDATPNLSDAIRLQYKAEARFLRAFFYFNLVQGWGDVPFKTNSTEEVGNLSIPRTDKKTIYDFIIKEMSGSANDLKSAGELSYLPGRISKSAAWGILARVYLFKAGEHYRDKQIKNEAEVKECFTQASHYAQMVMQEGHDLTDNYWDFFIDLCSDKYNTTDKKESIWEVEFAGNRSTDVRAEGRIGNIIGIDGPDLSSEISYKGKQDPGFSYAFIYTTPKLYNLYVDNKDINRFNWNVSPFKYTQSKAGGAVDGRLFEVGKLAEVKKQYYSKSYSYGDTTPDNGYGDREKKTADKNYSKPCGKYRREYEADKKSKNDTPINFPLLRYSDVLLMIAEAENEINNAPNQLAYDCINKVRQRAGISKLSGLTQEQFRKALKDERAMELCFEYTRRFDLIRWGDYIKAMNDLAPIAQAGTNWTLGPTNVYTYFQISDTYNYFPIPANEISSNSQINQNNPGW